jgi:CHAT domain-containing protein
MNFRTIVRISVFLFFLLSGSVIGNHLSLFAAGDQDPALLMTQGQQAYRHGAFDDALAHWREAARLFEARGDRVQQSRALVFSAQAAQAAGHTQQALQSLEVAWAIAQQEPDMEWRATVLAQLGRSYLAARQLDAASSYLTRAQEAAQGQSSALLNASIRNDQGVLAALQRREEEALEAFAETAQMARDANLPMVALHARINAARAAMGLDRRETCRLWLDEAMDQLTPMPPSHDKAVGLLNVGLLYGRLAPLLPEIREPLLLRAAGTLQEAVTVAEEIKDGRTHSYALGHLGHLYESESRFDEALRLTRHAAFAAQSVEAPESLYRWQWQTGRILAATGQLDDALASYRQAAATLQPIRLEVAAASADTSLTDAPVVRPLYFEFADLLLQRASLTEDAKVSEGYVLAARDTIETYKAAELRDYFRDECVDALQAKITRSETVSPKTAIVYPILFPTRMELLVSLPTGLTRTAIPVSADTVIQEIRAFRRTVEKRTTREYLPHAQQLYDWLIRPLEEEFQRLNITTLVFVPDSALRTIPMAALHDGTGFLIQKYAVALTPGITLTDPHPLNREKIRFLATGLTKGVQGFPALPYVAEEMDSIHRLYSGDQLLNQDFLTSKLEQELRAGRYGILHIATHGKFSTDVNDSFLLTFDGRLTMSKLDQLIGLFRYREDPLELLTLSACQTGVGDDRAALGTGRCRDQGGRPQRIGHALVHQR